MTTSRPPVRTTLPPYRTSSESPSSKIARSHALTQMPCSPVRKLQFPFDTPGPSPDETGSRKSYAAALFSEAARPSGPLGLDNAAWPPLASMVDPPPQQFVMAKDRVPPDHPQLKNKRRCQPQTRRHGKCHKQSRWKVAISACMIPAGLEIIGFNVK